MEEEERVRRASASVGASDTFFLNYGLFHAAFSALDLAIDVAIGRFLKLSHAEAHLVTVGVEMGRRMQLLINLADHSNHPNKAEIVRLMKAIQDDSRRNAFTHGFMGTNEETVTFFYRNRDKPLEAREYQYSSDGFQKHVATFLELASKLQSALGITSADFVEFAATVIKDSNKLTTFPEPPSAKE